MVEEIFGAEEGRKDPSVTLNGATRSPVLSFGLGLSGPFTHVWKGIMRLNLGLPDVSPLKCAPGTTVLRKALETRDYGLGGILGLLDCWV